MRSRERDAPEDVLVPSYRDHPAQPARVTMESLLYWGGDERGSGFGGRVTIYNCVPIATQVCHAVGAAYAFAAASRAPCACWRRRNFPAAISTRV